MYALCDEKCNQTGNEIHIEISKPIGIIYGRRGGFSRGGTGARAPPAVTPSMGIYILFYNALITF